MIASSFANNIALTRRHVSEDDPWQLLKYLSLVVSNRSMSSCTDDSSAAVRKQNRNNVYEGAPAKQT